jgi:energy-coupling factor transporter ATP-binding protein EcfA2
MARLRKWTGENMITKLTLRNFKSIQDQTYEFTNFDLLVGRNNSGKSTVLQALAIWQFCMDEFHRATRSGTTGTRILLPEFTALPLPEFNLLWHEKTDRKNVPFKKEGKTKYSPQLLLIEIDVEWLLPKNEKQNYCVRLRYESPQAIYAIPDEGGWKKFRTLDEESLLPRIAYVPPFSGLEPVEEWRDAGPIRKQVGKAQPGSVLRNLLVRVLGPQQTNGVETVSEKDALNVDDWKELTEAVHRWFSVDLQKPVYRSGATKIECEYKYKKKTYDLISGGSGFHQALTLLAFLYGYKPTTILLDEPDAHLHVNLQREILDFFKDQTSKRGIQFLIATHAEEFARGVDSRQIVSLLSGSPTRPEDKNKVVVAMADVSNVEVSQLLNSPFILYLEGETDERILRAWARTLGFEDLFLKCCIRTMGGGSKSQMKEAADRHFGGLTQYVKGVRKLMLFDYDSDEAAFHPPADNPALFEWKRKNIENYLFIPDAWIQAATGGELFHDAAAQTIKKFFKSENLNLPEGEQWRTLQTNIFKVLDGKKLLFDAEESLFNNVRKCQTPVILPREKVASSMKKEEMHQDIFNFFEKLRLFTA